MQPHHQKFTVVSIIVDPNPVKPALASDEEAQPLIYYWWTTKTCAPYLTGEKDLHWGGPFHHEHQAVNAIYRQSPGTDPDAITVLPWHLEKEDEPLQFFDSRAYPYELLVTLPLDELTERAFCQGADMSRERLRLTNGMKFQIGLHDPDEQQDFIVNQVEMDFMSIEGRLFGEVGFASFTMPITVHIRSEKEIAQDALKDLLKPTVSMEDYYPGKVKSQIQARAVL